MPRPLGASRGILAIMFASRRVGLLLASLVLVAPPLLAAPPPAFAGPESDIPGIPLPGPVVSGRLGGPIYDVVFRVDAPPGHVIVAGLSGTAGTDFDLYLFDASATTVVSNRGLVAKSTGPVSSENLSYPTFAGGTYYIDLNGASDVLGTYTLTVQLVADRTVPIATLTLGQGRRAINSTTVPVELTASATLSGTAQMSFSADGVTFGPWQTYTTVSSWTFPPGDGVKTLWAKVRSGVGIESAPVSDSIVLDTRPPAVSVIAPTPDSSVAGLRPTFLVRFDEPIEPDSWRLLGLVVQGATGLLVPGTYTYDAATRTGRFVPSADLVPGAPYAVTVGSVRDLAGNALVPIGSWTITPLVPTTLSLATSRSVVTYGESVSLSGQAMAADQSLVQVEIRQAGASSFVPVTSLGLAGGRFEMTAVPPMNAWYRATFAGSPTQTPAESGAVRVIVRRTVALAGISSSVTRTVRAGKAITLSAQVGPPAAGVSVSFRLYRYDPLRRTWRYAGSFGRATDATGRATLTWTPSAGRFYWRVSVVPTPEFANNVSPAYSWSVIR